MNDNNFDRDNFSSGNQAPDVYSKQYTPSGSGYAEETTSRVERKISPRPNRKLLAVIAVILAVLKLCSAAVLVSSRIAFSYYDEMYREYVAELEKNNENTTPQEIESPNVTETESGEADETELLFSSDADTEIKNSASGGVR